jgi:D-alanyl-lipoteichoic acid acyltransferase DltB (MBOAT superfamily)
VLWGLYHGVLLDIHAWASRRKLGLKWSLLNRALLLVAVLIGWTFFVSPNLAFWQHLFGSLFGFYGIGSRTELTRLYSRTVMITILIAVVLVIAGISETSNLLRKISHPTYPSALVQRRQLLVISMILIFVALSLLVIIADSSAAGQPFIYALF